VVPLERARSAPPPWGYVTWGIADDTPNRLTAIVEALRSAGATEGIIAAAVKAGGEFENAPRRQFVGVVAAYAALARSTAFAGSKATSSLFPRDAGAGRASAAVLFCALDGASFGAGGACAHGISLLRIRETILSDRDVPPENNVNFSLNVGTSVPSSVRVAEVVFEFTPQDSL
jgi:hypothetical protein